MSSLTCTGMGSPGFLGFGSLTSVGIEKPAGSAYNSGTSLDIEKYHRERILNDRKQLSDGKLVVGDYIITRLLNCIKDNSYLIEYNSGKSVEISKEKFEKLISDYYKQNF